jgi:AraC-like DNA-binding protein
VPDICRELNYGKTLLYNLFKENTGKSIKDYYINLKIDEAKHLLRKRALSLKEISETLCFCTVSYFCNTFKRVMQMTPSQYLSTVSY